MEAVSSNSFDVDRLQVSCVVPIYRNVPRVWVSVRLLGNVQVRFPQAVQRCDVRFLDEMDLMRLAQPRDWRSGNLLLSAKD